METVAYLVDDGEDPVLKKCEGPTALQDAVEYIQLHCTNRSAIIWQRTHLTVYQRTRPYDNNYRVAGVWQDGKWIAELGGLALPKPDPDLEPEEPNDIILKINGVTQRCDCGCNVFRYTDASKLRARCNGCKDEYRVERVEATNTAEAST